MTQLLQTQATVKVQKVATPASVDDQEIQKGLNRVGLTLSETELSQLKTESILSLGSRGLHEIGQIFILASAILPFELGQLKKKVTFEELFNKITDAAHSPGVPIYSWTSHSLQQYRLYLTLINGQPALRLGEDSALAA